MNKEGKVIEFDCRGLEFTEFKADVSQNASRAYLFTACHPLSSFCIFSVSFLFVCLCQQTDFTPLFVLPGEQGEWEAKGVESSTPFTSIDLQEGEWYDYDEKTGEEVSIKEVKWEIRRA